MKLTTEQLLQKGEAMMAFSKSRPVQVYNFAIDKWLDDANPSWIHDNLYRAKPEPKTRPWSKPEDVPGPVCWIRQNNDPEFDQYLIGRIVPDGFWTLNTSGNQLWEWDVFSEDREDRIEYSTTRRDDDWHKCEITEEEA